MFWNWFKPKNNQQWRTEQASKWRLVRQSVLKRDKFQCQNPSCKRTETKKLRMAVHHINDASNNPSLIFDMDNLITLCHGRAKCHNNFHKWNGGFSKPCSNTDLERWFRYERIRKSGAVTLFFLENVWITLALITLGVLIIAYGVSKVILM